MLCLVVAVSGWWITRNGAVRYGLCTLARAATRLVGENLHTPLGWERGGGPVVAISGCRGRDNRFNRYSDTVVQFRSPTFTIVIYESAMKTARARGHVSFMRLQADTKWGNEHGARPHLSLQRSCLITWLITDSPCCHWAASEPGHPSLSRSFHCGTRVNPFVWNKPLERIYTFLFFLCRLFHVRSLVLHYNRGTS